jgi:hydrogenase maturation protease
MKGKVLVLGLGNILMGDEGIGVRSIAYLQEHSFPDHVTLLDGGTGGFHLLSLFQEYERLIIIDATMGKEGEGTVRVSKPRFASEFPRTLTSHDTGLRDLVQSAELLGELPDISLVTISIQRCDEVKMELSEPILGALPEVHRIVNRLIMEFR